MARTKRKARRGATDISHDADAPTAKKECPDSMGSDLSAPCAREEFTEDDELCVNTVRVLCADMVEEAKSGHPGAPMGCAPMAHVLWTRVMAFDPRRPDWMRRDRFVLSNGHASALQYAMLHLSGYDVSLEDLKAFRQLGSNTPGHPENFMTPGVEVCTGPLGQGISNAVGLALAERHLRATFNTDEHAVVDNYTYVICGDGCLQEGVSSEASSLAGHWGLGRLVVLYDDNAIQIDGGTDLAFTEDVLLRYQAYGWHTQRVEDGTDMAAILRAIQDAKAETERPSIIKVRTVIGHGSPNEGTAGVHGAPLKADNLAAAKRKLGMDPSQSFAISDEVYAAYRSRDTLGGRMDDGAFAAYGAAFPQEHAQLLRRGAREAPAELLQALLQEEDTLGLGCGTPSRKSSGAVLDEVARRMPEVLAGSADLTGSNGLSGFKKIGGCFQRGAPEGRFLHYGVREHAMVAIANGLSAYGLLRPVVATFLQFFGYALGALRVSALSRFPVICVATHDSIKLGEDGPTHQPVEMLESLRATPNLMVLRPCDAAEVRGAYAAALSSDTTPSVIVLTRQNLPRVEGTAAAEVRRGAYSVRGEGASLKLVIVASGSEVALACDAAEELEGSGIGIGVRVVSMVCQELFDGQEQAYRLQLFPDNVAVMSIEAAAPHGWERYAHAQIGLTRFGVSAPGDAVTAALGFTKERVVAEATRLVNGMLKASFPSKMSLGGHLPTPAPY